MYPRKTRSTLKNMYFFFLSKFRITVRNRRYAAMQELRHSGTYFSEKEMERRDPLLYDQLIGRHQTEEERMRFGEDGDSDEEKK